GGEDFDALMHKYSQDTGLQAYPDGYVFSSGEMVPEFEQAVDSVSEGEITICKSTYGYHIIKRIPIEYPDIKDKIEETILKDRIDGKMQEWEKEYGITVTTNDVVIKSIK
ncbi:MAG: peptidylprolyl isomerase, partial [Clostridia bacterium]|nr:peptidylprolyl isomerase [Clostridia bacterium]